MKLHRHLLVVVGVLVAALLLFFCFKVFAPTNTILFPKGGETLITGETYTLSWTGGPDPTSVFLIDTSKETEGASVSVVHRVYGVENKESYKFTIPPQLARGTYKLQIGNVTSNPFTIDYPYGYLCSNGTEFTLSPMIERDRMLLRPASNMDHLEKTLLFKKSAFYENGAIRVAPDNPNILLSTREFTTPCKAMQDKGVFGTF